MYFIVSEHMSPVSNLIRSNGHWLFSFPGVFSFIPSSRGVRQSLKRMSASEPHLVVREGHSADYLVELAQATFALCPSGWSDWSPRVFEAMAMGAVPVIYADGIRLPFEDAIDYSCAILMRLIIF